MWGQKEAWQGGAALGEPCAALRKGAVLSGPLTVGSFVSGDRSRSTSHRSCLGWNAGWMGEEEGEEKEETAGSLCGVSSPMCERTLTCRTSHVARGQTVCDAVGAAL